MFAAHSGQADRSDAAGTIQELLNQFFQVALKQARESGVRLRLRTDFDALQEINGRNRATWAPLFPMFDPAHSDLGPSNAVWIEGVNDRGETVAICAARAFYWPCNTLADEALSLRMFYRDPVAHLAHGDRVELPETPATRITGRSACLGSLWVSPSHRGAGLTKITSRLCKAYGYMHWDSEICWSFSNPAHIASGVVRAFGPINIDQGARLRLGGRELPAMITYQRRAAFLMDVARAIWRGAVESSRRIETTLTNSSLPVRCQGSASR